MADRMSKEKRSALMSRIRSKNTKPELVLFSYLEAHRLRFERHYNVPGRPDAAVPGKKLALFMHGTFWHGWRLPSWEAKLSQKWREKLRRNRLRHKRDTQRLRRAGWKVMVIWEHDLHRRKKATLERAASFLRGKGLSQERAARTRRRPARSPRAR